MVILGPFLIIIGNLVLVALIGVCEKNNNVRGRDGARAGAVC